MTYLSPHFTYEEMVHSDYAIRKGLDNTPNAEQLESLKHLCVFYLEHIREEALSPIIVTSGFRNTILNGKVGGSKNSQHCKGRAADIRALKLSTLGLMNTIVRSDLMQHIDQIIYEFGGWVHVGIPRVGQAPRRQALMIFEPGKYLPFDPKEIAERRG